MLDNIEYGVDPLIQHEIDAAFEALGTLQRQLAAATFGDCDLSGAVDQDDLDIVSFNFGQTPPDAPADVSQFDRLRDTLTTLERLLSTVE